MSEVLTPEQLASFEADGYLALRAAFPRQAALEIQAFIWGRLEKHFGILRDDPSTWRQEIFKLNRTGRHPVYRAIGSERMCAAFDQILGPGRWTLPDRWGGILVTFPEADRLPHQVARPPWHWDGDVKRELEGLAGLFVFVLFNELEPGGGGTFLLAGSPRLIVDHYRALPPEERMRRPRYHRARFLQSHPWLVELSRQARQGTPLDRSWFEPGARIDGVPVRVVEVCGAPGDAFLCHPSILHARSTNARNEPRFMRVRGIAREPVAAA